ncbi:hypothetical protein PsYK624_162890 [Phanerochaete sordida]|uniref:Uncharacterized protein n=1 Tax=Phanerochaete sordida TaxID=48140 RepID=A0A9P3GRT9_9APHY|nr:hypothetical protein PsYK624_162890 [Phanerochaete sordida]
MRRFTAAGRRTRAACSGAPPAAAGWHAREASSDLQRETTARVRSRAVRLCAHRTGRHRTAEGWCLRSPRV